MQNFVSVWKQASECAWAFQEHKWHPDVQGQDNVHHSFKRQHSQGQVTVSQSVSQSVILFIYMVCTGFQAYRLQWNVERPLKTQKRSHEWE